MLTTALVTMTAQAMPVVAALALRSPQVLRLRDATLLEVPQLKSVIEEAEAELTELDAFVHELELELFGIVRSGSPRGRRASSTSPLRRQPGSPGSLLGSPVKARSRASPAKGGSVRGDMSDAFWAHLDALFVRDSSSSIPQLERATAVADLARHAGRSPVSDSYAARAERSKALAQYFEEETARYAREYEAVIAQRAARLAAGL